MALPLYGTPFIFIEVQKSIPEVRDVLLRLLMIYLSRIFSSIYPSSHTMTREKSWHISVRSFHFGT